MTTIPLYSLHQGHRPLLISMPHVGTHIPENLRARYTDKAQQVPDTDWHLPILYDFARELGASLLIATHSRYVIDLNRPPNDQNLYPGQKTTNLCPLDDFDSAPLYQPGQAPDAAEVAERRSRYWEPYHQALQNQLARMQAQHGTVALWEAHSIRAEVPRLFEGRLPDFNLGTNDDQSCMPDLARTLLAQLEAVPGHSAVLNGRFKGGYITREYGKPQQGVHAIQLEMTQRNYMEEHHPFAYQPQLAATIQPVLRQLLETVLERTEAQGPQHG